MTTFSRTPVELPVAAERDGALPLAGQISGQLRAALADGRLAAGERLPSSRALAASLGVSRTVVTAAYTQLFAEGWLEGRHGSGTYVADGAPGSQVAVPPAGLATGPLASVRVIPDSSIPGPGRPGRAGQWAATGQSPAGHPVAGRHRPGRLAPGLAVRRGPAARRVA